MAKISLLDLALCSNRALAFLLRESFGEVSVRLFGALFWAKLQEPISERRSQAGSDYVPSYVVYLLLVFHHTWGEIEKGNSSLHSRNTSLDYQANNQIERPFGLQLPLGIQPTISTFTYSRLRYPLRHFTYKLSCQTRMT